MRCVFCEIAKGIAPAYRIYESEEVVCFLDSDPINEGHVLITPCKHYLDVDEIPEKTLSEIMALSQRIVKVLREKYHPDGYSIMQNGGVFNDVGHYHLHIFPRYQGDGFAWTFGAPRAVTGPIAEELRRLLEEQGAGPHGKSCKHKSRY